MTIRIITVGKSPARELWLPSQDYLKRFPAHIQIEWIYIKHGVGDSKISMTKESERILSKIPDGFRTVLLDERGDLLNSEQFSNFVYETANNICFIIGGAHGVTPEVRDKAWKTLSLSRLVFPHQLVRLLLAEQLYRGFTIHSGHPYHNA